MVGRSKSQSRPRLHQVFCARRVWREQDERVRVEQSLCSAMLCLTSAQPSCHSRASPREPLWCCLACRTSSTPPSGPAGPPGRSLGHRQEALLLNKCFSSQSASSGDRPERSAAPALTQLTEGLASPAQLKSVCEPNSRPCTQEKLDMNALK